MRKVSPSVGGSDTACFATEHASRGTRRSTENGGTRSLQEPELLSLLDNADGDREFRDRSTGLPLNPEMVRKARELEMQYMEELKVLEDSDRDACMAETGRRDPD